MSNEELTNKEMLELQDIVLNKSDVSERVYVLKNLILKMGERIHKIDEMMRNGELQYTPKHKACGSYLKDWRSWDGAVMGYKCPTCDVLIVKGSKAEESIKCMGQ